MEKTPPATLAPSSTHTVKYGTSRVTPQVPSSTPLYPLGKGANAGSPEAIPHGLSEQLQRRGAAIADDATGSPLGVGRPSSPFVDVHGINRLVKQLAFSYDNAECYIPQHTEKAKRTQQQNQQAVMRRKQQQARARVPAFVVPNRTRDHDATFDDMAAAAAKHRANHKQWRTDRHVQPPPGSHQHVHKKLVGDKGAIEQRVQKLLEQCNTFEERHSTSEPAHLHTQHPIAAGGTISASDTVASTNARLDIPAAQQAHVDVSAAQQTGSSHTAQVLGEGAITWTPPVPLTWQESIHKFGVHKTGAASRAVRHVYQMAQTGAMLGLSHRERLQAGIMELSAALYTPMLLPPGR